MVGPVSEEQERSLQVAIQNIDRLNRLINDLLDVSRIEAGKMELQRAPIDLREIVLLVRDTFEPLARQRGLELQVSVDAEPLTLSADRDRLIQVFTNLTQNAMKFTAQGHVTLSARRVGEEIVCSVEDSGAGIGPADLPRVFGKFQQFASAQKSAEKGSGLGLSLCKGFVELHAGHMDVQSTLGQGTTFTFTLPLALEKIKAPD
jgi:signal transduction histidine kinase